MTVIAADDSDPKPITPGRYLHRSDAQLSAVWLSNAQALSAHLLAIPVTWLIAPDGKLVKGWTGVFEGSKVDQALQGAMAKTPSL